MLNYFLSELDVRLLALEAAEVGGAQAGFIRMARAKLTSFRDEYGNAQPHRADAAWNEAYRLERIIALAEPSATLLQQISQRLDVAAAEKIPEHLQLAAAFKAMLPLTVDTAQGPPKVKPCGEPKLRRLLMDILEATHYYSQRKFFSRPIQKSATRRLIILCLTACAVFLAPYVCLYGQNILEAGNFKPALDRWAWLPLWTTMSAGFFGAMFSRLWYLQSNWNRLSLGALTDARDLVSILLRGAVGVAGAVVVYFVLLSGLIGGQLFPDLRRLTIEVVTFPLEAKNDALRPMTLLVPNGQLALLVVWSFLAGFSERLVPSILRQTEARLTEKPAASA
jgi:hypothetical protein